MTERLTLEARVTGLLEHPSIVSIYELGEHEEFGTYYTMRVVRERSLEHVFRSLGAGEHPDYSLARFVTILRTALLALQYGHDRGVVHRDIKPENILVGAYGEVFLIDWGVAKIDNELATDGIHDDTITDTNAALVGTPQYMSPEQARGDNHLIDGRTDVYAIGAVLYEVLTREPIFEAQNVLALLFKVSETQPPTPSERAPDRDIPETLEEICSKAIAKDPADRYQSAQEMARELELFLEGVKELERNGAMAAELVERAKQERAEYDEMLGRYEDALAALTEAQAGIPGWAGAEEKEPVWRAEREVDELRTDSERRFGTVIRTLNQALGYVPDHADARRALAELYWTRFQLSERAGDAANAVYFESLVHQYNDGDFDTLLAGLATLTVTCRPANAELTLYRFERGLHRLQPVRVASCDAPMTSMRLPHGSYTLRVSSRGFVDLDVPLRLAVFEKPIYVNRLWGEPFLMRPMNS